MKTDIRRQLQRPFFNRAFLPPKASLENLMKILWQKPEREFHYFGQELAFCYKQDSDINDILIYEYMIRHKSWWDTVDYIANKLVGNYFLQFPNEVDSYVDKWISSNNIWLQRSTLLFQLKYKDRLDTQLLQSIINRLTPSNEFFINKAIGWILSEYSRTNPIWVVKFVESANLSSMSKKVALRVINS